MSPRFSIKGPTAASDEKNRDRDRVQASDAFWRSDREFDKKRRTQTFCVLTTLLFMEKDKTNNQSKAMGKIFHLSAIPRF